MSDFVLGVISGSGATLAGFCFTIAWDLWKMRRDEKLRNRLIFHAVENELDENIKIAEANTKLLTDEMASLSNNKYLLHPMLRFKEGMWDLLKSNLPDELLRQENLLGKLREMSQFASHMNDGISSRQQFKDNMGALSGFTEIVKSKNAILLEEISRFTKEAGETLALCKIAKNEI